MRLSVVICTRNRADYLCQALRSISRCEHPPAGDWEVVVVDNGSADQTQEVATDVATEVATTEAGNFALSVVEEAIPGLSHARNRGIRVARGDWILWTDDDVTVGEKWLIRYYEAIRNRPDARAFGGPIHIVLEGQPEGWLVNGLNIVKSAFAGLAADDIGDTFAATGVVPYGANFALRRNYLERIGFDPDLGRHPKHQLRGGEETQVIRQAVRDGPGYWLRDASVSHHIDPGRQTRRYLRDYYFSFGFRQGIEISERLSGRRLVRETLVSLRSALKSDAGLLLNTPADMTTQLLKDAARSWGRVAGIFHALLSRQKAASAPESTHEY